MSATPVQCLKYACSKKLGHPTCNVLDRVCSDPPELTVAQPWAIARCCSFSPSSPPEMGVAQSSKEKTGQAPAMRARAALKGPQCIGMLIARIESPADRQGGGCRVFAKETAMRCPEITIAGTRTPDSTDVSPKHPHHTAAGTGELSCSHAHVYFHANTSYRHAVTRLH